MKGKQFAINFILILSVVLIMGCHRPSSQGADGWKSYTNEKYGYGFMYPSDCFYGRMPSDCKETPPEQRRSACLCFLDATDPDNVFMQAFLGEEDQLTLAAFTISHYDTPVFNPPPGTDLVAWLKANFSGVFEDIPNESNLGISGVPAMRLHSPASPMAPSFDEIYYIQDGYLFRINMLDVDNEDNRTLYHRMLSTFSLDS